MYKISRSGTLTTGEGAPGTHRIGRSVDHIFGLDVIANRKIPDYTGCRTTVIQCIASHFSPQGAEISNFAFS
jgi:hypothetical protein